MGHEPSIFDEVVREAEDAADAEGLADLEAGRTVPWETVERQLLTWGSDNKLPSPR
jgi:predicted transcriptional regulator